MYRHAQGWRDWSNVPTIKEVSSSLDELFKMNGSNVDYRVHMGSQVIEERLTPRATPTTYWLISNGNTGMLMQAILVDREDEVPYAVDRLKKAANLLAHEVVVNEITRMRIVGV